MLRHPPANNQRTVALFLADGHHDALLRRLSQLYKERWEIMERGARAASARMPLAADERRHRASGSRARPGSIRARLEAAAAKRGILIEPGDVHFLDAATAPRNFFRLGFSSIATERIEPGLERLGETIREQLAEA